MTDTIDAAPALRSLLDKHAQPDPSTISTLPKAGTKLDFVGHAEVTRILIQEDPLWTWEPAGWDPQGGPLIIKRGDELTMWGWLTVHNKRIPCVGTCVATKHDADKELIGDLLRNGAMRFGIALNLWSKAEKAEAGFQAEAPPAPQWDEARWKELAGKLRALPDASKAKVLGQLDQEGLFSGRSPNTPFADSQLDRIAHHIERAETVTATPQALDVLVDALGIDDPLNPPEGVVIEPWMWDLAGVEDLDAYKWPYAKTKIRQADLMERAFLIAERLQKDDPSILTPYSISDIHGPVATELRLSVLKGETF